jgi:hypothetical protein
MDINSKPFPSWIWVDTTYKNADGTIDITGGYWDAPKPLPTINKKVFRWDEELLDWVEVN